MVHWPCILKLHGDDELIFLNAVADLEAECESLIWSADDRVVDSAGFSYSLQKAESGNTTLKLRDQRLSVDEVTMLIQSHEFSLAEVCLTKIRFLSIEEAIRSLSYS